MKTINNNIEEVLVHFENSKLLKEAGFDVLCKYIYDFRDNTLGEMFEYVNSKNTAEFQLIAPTLQIVIDWIRVNFGIHITVTPQSLLGRFGNGNHCNWYYTLTYDENESSVYFNTPDEAKQAAIKYVLEKLILKK